LAPIEALAGRVLATALHSPVMRGARLSGRGPTTFLKRQKEQQRAARANAKRAARQARRENRKSENTTDAPDPDDVSLMEPLDGPPESDVPPVS
jgi:hypothetical protein